MSLPMSIVSVACGGALGACSRYAVNVWVTSETHSLPLATLLVNALGCLLAGILFAVVLERSIGPSPWLLFLMTGFLGAFTTFSAFSIETLSLALQENMWLAGLNAAANMLLSLVAVATGFTLTRWALKTGLFSGGA